MNNQRGEILLGTILVACLIAVPLSWGIDAIARRIAAPSEQKNEQQIPVCQIEGKIYYIELLPENLPPDNREDSGSNNGKNVGGAPNQ